MTDADFFAPRPEQPTLFSEGICKPGWVGAMPEAPAQPLYVPDQTLEITILRKKLAEALDRIEELEAQ